MRSPDQSFFTAVGIPAKAFKPFSMAKGLSFAKGKSLLLPCIINNLGHILIVDCSLSEEGSTFKASFFLYLLNRVTEIPTSYDSLFGVHIMMWDYFYQDICQDCGTQQAVFTDAGVLAKPFSPFSIVRGFNFSNGKSLFVPCVTRNLGHKDRDGFFVSKEGSTSNAHFLYE